MASTSTSPLPASASASASPPPSPFSSCSSYPSSPSLSQTPPNNPSAWSHFALTPSPTPVHYPALDLFPDGGFVRLRSRVNQKYVHADDDWVGISLRRQRSGRGLSPLTAVWRVHIMPVEQEDHTVFLLLQSAAYGRFLASSHHMLPGYTGFFPIQGDLDEHDLMKTLSFKWAVERLDADHDYVIMRQPNLSLCTNLRRRSWNTGATIDFNSERGVTIKMQWTVEAVAATPAPLPLPITPQAMVRIRGGRSSGRSLLFWRRAGHGTHQHPQRIIWHVRADDEGNFNENPYEWQSFFFNDHSVFNLRTELAMCQDNWNGDLLSITLCTWPTYDGRLMPLVSDLPRSREPMYIVVLTTGSPAAEDLLYPQI